LLQAAPAAELQALRPHLELVDLVREAVLIEAGAPLTHVYLPYSGVLSMRARLSEGQTVGVAMIGCDSVFGGFAAFGGQASLTDAWSCCQARLPFFALPTFRRPQTAAPLFEPCLRGMSRRCSRKPSNPPHATPPTRSARIALAVARARDLCNSESLPLTQEVLAQMIGARRNAVSIVANALQRAGIISYSRGRIEINNVESLKETSCECYHAVRRQHDRLLKIPG
jgi:CRP-like cAMP-binding protein